MFGLFGRSRQGIQGKGTAEAQPSTPPNSIPQSSQQHTATWRELVRVVLRDTLRLHGIPNDWIGCEFIKLSRGADESAILIQLVIHQWHQGLVRYAPALQQQLILGLDRFDPVTDHSKYIITWKFAPGCGYPETAMPPPEFWSARPTPEVKAKFDLPPSQLDEPRDSEFAATVPSELR